MSGVDGIFAVEGGKAFKAFDHSPVSYTHLTLPTNKEV